MSTYLSIYLPLNDIKRNLKVAAVCEALRRRGLFLGAPGAGGGASTMLSFDGVLQDLLGTPALPFGQLEDALGPHVEPAEPSSLAATVS